MKVALPRGTLKSVALFGVKFIRLSLARRIAKEPLCISQFRLLLLLPHRETLDPQAAMREGWPIVNMFRGVTVTA